MPGQARMKAAKYLCVTTCILTLAGCSLPVLTTPIPQDMAETPSTAATPVTPPASPPLPAISTPASIAPPVAGAAISHQALPEMRPAPAIPAAIQATSAAVASGDVVAIDRLAQSVPISSGGKLAGDGQAGGWQNAVEPRGAATIDLSAAGNLLLADGSNEAELLQMSFPSLPRSLTSPVSAWDSYQPHKPSLGDVDAYEYDRLPDSDSDWVSTSCIVPAMLSLAASFAHATGDYGGC